MVEASTKKLDWRALVWFILLTFLPTLALVWWSYSNGQTLTSGANVAAGSAVGLSMFFPGLAAFITRKFVTRESFKGAGLKLGPKMEYLKTYLLIVAGYAVIYALTWFFMTPPDFTMTSFARTYGLPAPENSQGLIWLFVLSTFVVAPIFNLIPSFGEEFGWRGLLLEKLLPLGQRPALLISGMIWALWHTPFVLLLGFGYGMEKLWGAVLFFVIVTCLGIWMGSLRLKTDSVFLPTFAHATFNANAYGIWVIVFPVVNPLYGGKTGLIALPMYLAIGLWFWFRKTASFPVSPQKA
jgi:uncharacterized protein